MNATKSSVAGLSQLSGSGSITIGDRKSDGEPNAKSPYLQEINTNISRRRQRQTERRQMPVPLYPSRNKQPRNGSVNQQSFGKTFPRGTGIPNMNRRSSDQNSSVAQIEERRASALLDDEYEPADFGEVEERITLCDVEVQVRPKTKEKAVQVADGSATETLVNAQKENEELVEENFKLRRLVEDLKFRLLETEHDKDVLHEELTQLDFIRNEIPSSPLLVVKDTRSQEVQTNYELSSSPLLVQKDLRSQEVQTDILEPITDSSPHLVAAEIVSKTNFQSPSPSFDELSSEREPTFSDLFFDRRNSTSLLPVKELSNTKNLSRDRIIGIFAAHLERENFLSFVKDETVRRARNKLQAIFKGHFERKRFLEFQIS